MCNPHNEPFNTICRTKYLKKKFSPPNCPPLQIGIRILALYVHVIGSPNSVCVYVLNFNLFPEVDDPKNRGGWIVADVCPGGRASKGLRRRVFFSIAWKKTNTRKHPLFFVQILFFFFDAKQIRAHAHDNNTRLTFVYIITTGYTYYAYALYTYNVVRSYCV